MTHAPYEWSIDQDGMFDGNNRVGVLMSTYAKDKAANLAMCLDSISAQTRSPDEILLVVDGPVDDEQETIIATFAASRSGVRIIRRPVSGGLARALNQALAACQCEYVMRMDADDVCAPDRLEIQMAYITTHPDVDLVASWAEEFYDDGAPSKMKVSPCDHDNVAKALRWRNVLVHPSILVRTVALRAIGGYRTRFGMLEDYDLFVRLIVAGGSIHVIPKALIRIRSSIAQRTRRGGWSYLRHEIAFRRECLRIGFMTPREFVVITALYAGFRLISGSMRHRLTSLVRS
jgi:glycosyltransferase involved in cell wall biosynthesis